MSAKNIVENAIKSVAEANEIREYEIITECDTIVGKNYFGILTPIIINGKQVGKNGTMHIIVKIPPKITTLRANGSLAKMFAREIFVYTKLLPKYEHLLRNTKEVIENKGTVIIIGTQETTDVSVRNENEHDKLIKNGTLDETVMAKTKDGDFEYNWAKCYYTNETVPNEVLVFQNLRADGYKVYPGMFFDLEHILISIKALAVFHGLSVVLKALDEECFKEYSDMCIFFYEDLSTCSYFDILKSNAEQTASLLKEELGSILEKLSKDVNGHVLEATVKARLKVIGHGDAWSGNILFKYKDGQPTKACYVDYQIAQSCSPAYDVLYLIATSTNKQLRQTSYNTILTTYHETLSIFLNKFGINIFELEDLKKELKLVAPACMLIANTSFKNWLGLEERNIFGNKANDDTGKGAATYIQIIEDLLRDFEVYGYF